MNKYKVKLDEDGSAITCTRCDGYGCDDCHDRGVELVENEEYTEQQINKIDDMGVW